MKKSKEIFVAVKIKNNTKIFFFKNRRNALRFIKDLKEMDNNIKYAITL